MNPIDIDGRSVSAYRINVGDTIRRYGVQGEVSKIEETEQGRVLHFRDDVMRPCYVGTSELMFRIDAPKPPTYKDGTVLRTSATPMLRKDGHWYWLNAGNGTLDIGRSLTSDETITRWVKDGEATIVYGGEA